jgi:uncharacterized repeat protein (TIGR03803 family)
MKRFALYFLLVCLGRYTFAQTNNESLLYSFAPGEGAEPVGGLAFDGAGNLYGTTLAGGQFNCGTVFKLTTDGTQTVLYNFDCGDNGKFPMTGVTLDAAGNLYGTTSAGGTMLVGLVYKIDTQGNYTVLHQFGGDCFQISGCTGLDGQIPLTPLLLDGQGNIYGATSQGGRQTNPCLIGGVLSGCGNLFKITSAGTYSVLFEFYGLAGGGTTPSWNIMRDGQGNTFGTAFSGVGGTLFELTAARKYTPLALTPIDKGTFAGESYFTRSTSGDFFGGLTGFRQIGVGIWRVSPGRRVFRNTWFCTDCQSDSAQGWNPQGPLMFSSGILYGTMREGGAFIDPICNCGGGGVVFGYNPGTEKETLLYSFPNEGTTSDGWHPTGGVIRDAQGNFYGTLSEGGTFGQGAVFKLTPQ